MTTKLIKLQDGVLVEVEVRKGEVREISGGAAELVDKVLAQIEPILVKTCHPVVTALEKINQEASVEQAEVQLGLSFEAEGTVYVAKSKASANINVKLVLKKV